MVYIAWVESRIRGDNGVRFTPERLAANQPCPLTFRQALECRGLVLHDTCMMPQIRDRAGTGPATRAALLGAWFVADGRPEQEQAGRHGPDRVAALKQFMAASQKQLRQYEWIETTIISMKGEEKPYC
jgi:hypothetical protein